MSKNKYDWIGQWDFQQDLNGITENAVFPEYVNQQNYQPRTLVDETLEIIDPTPNVHTMFVQFNEKYFWNKLLPVQVRWSQRMTSCAGTCTFHPRNRECIIALSAPLLKLRPRKDLVETLLHEMIHGYLFLTNNNRDRDGHGPEFCNHMIRINKIAGTNITIYHSFHNEVKLYQQHWWRCSGPCQNRPPYFGTVRRAMNRPPGPSDYWFQNHKINCGGEFIKIREPDAKPKIKNKNNTIKVPTRNNIMDRYIISINPKDASKNVPNSSPPKLPKANNCQCNGSAKTSSGVFIKLGSNTNNVYGFGTSSSGSPKLKSGSNKTSPKTPTRVNFSGVVGGNATGRSNLLDKYFSPPVKKIEKKTELMNKNSIKCPVCDIDFPQDLINIHIDICLIKKRDDESLPIKRTKLSDLNEKNSNTDVIMDKKNFYTCPSCQETFPDDIINIHLDECLHIENNINNTHSKENTNNKRKLTNNSKNNSTSSTNFQECPFCSDFFTDDIIYDHVNLCEVKNKSKKNTVVDLSTSPMKDKTDRDNIRCPTCNQNIRIADYIVHVETCLAAELEQINSDKNIIILNDDIYKPGCSKQINNINDKYECLVCNAMISKSIPLNEHLDYCVSVTYRDTSTLDVSSKELPSVVVDDDDDDDEEEDERHLCPICMNMIEDKLMAKHVDECIKDIN